MASEWTVETLKEHFTDLLAATDKRNEQRFQAQEQQTSSTMLAAKEAVIKAEAASEKRFDNTNEWRQAMSDRDNRLMPREEANSKFRAMEDKLTDAIKRLDLNDGNKKGLRDGWGYVVGATGLAAAIITAIATYKR
jgi:hypothetical protein